jgi:hypothetical protein
MKETYLLFVDRDEKSKSVDFGGFSENLGYPDYDRIVNILTVNGWANIQHITLYVDDLPVRRWSQAPPVLIQELVGEEWRTVP